MKAWLAWPIILIIFLTSPAFAQWEYGGKWIGNYTSGTGLAMVTDTLTGNTFVVWNKIYGGDHDIFIQCIDSAGYALWDEGGRVVYADDYFTQWYVSALLDGAGGVFVVWSDYRHTPDEGVELYGQRLDSEGNLLWSPEGMKLTADSTDHTEPQLYDDGNGGFIMVFVNHVNGADIGAQRVNSEGQILWDSTGIFLTKAPYSQYEPRTCKASNSTFITIWRDWRDSHDYDSDIYMQRFDLDGNILWQPDGIPAVHWSHDQGYLWDGHDVVADGQGGAVVVWVDFRLSNIGNPILFADRFSAQGQSMWQVNGKQLGDEVTNEALGCQAFRMGDGFMFRWSGNGGGFDVSYTDYLGDFFWDEVTSLDPRFPKDNLVIAESDSIFLFMVYTDVGGWRNYGSKVDIQGTQYWPNEPFLDDPIDWEHLMRDGSGGMIAVWIRRNTTSIEISRIYADGHVGGDTTTAIYNSDNQLPSGLKLWQNYPNPFNTSTSMQFEIDYLSDITAVIYDILGRQAQNIDLGTLSSGSHSLILDLSDLTSGIYFLALISDRQFSNSIGLVMLK